MHRIRMKQLRDIFWVIVEQEQIKEDADGEEVEGANYLQYHYLLEFWLDGHEDDEGNYKDEDGNPVVLEETPEARGKQLKEYFEKIFYGHIKGQEDFDKWMLPKPAPRGKKEK